MPKKGVEHVLGRMLIGYLVSIAYIAALTFLLPLLLIPSTLFSQVPTIVYICVGVIILCALLLLWLKGDFGSALISLGLGTLIPGILGILFAVFGEEKFLGYLGQFVSISEVEPLIGYVTANVPKLWIITAGYVLVGFLLYNWGSKITRRVTLISRLRRQFGPRARVR